MKGGTEVDGGTGESAKRGTELQVANKWSDFTLRRAQNNWLMQQKGYGI